MTALHQLCARGKLDKVRAKLVRGVEVNDKNVASRIYALLSVIRRQMSAFHPLRGGLPTGVVVERYFRCTVVVLDWNWSGAGVVLERYLRGTWEVFERYLRGTGVILEWYCTVLVLESGTALNEKIWDAVVYFLMAACLQ